MAHTTEDAHKPWKAIFGLLWLSQSVSMIGSSLVQFALIWWITQKTGSALNLTVATTINLVPSVILGPFIGALVDRWNRKLTMIFSDVLTALGALVLFALFLTDTLQLWHIYVLMFIRSVTGTFQWPAMLASLSLLVPDAYLTKVAGMNMAVRGVSTILAPILGALLITWQPMHNVMLVDVVTAGLAVGLMAFAVLPESRQEPQALRPRALWAEVRSASSFIYHWAGLRKLILAAVVLNLLATPAFSLFPLLITRHYQGGVWQLSYAQTIMGIGFLFGALVFSVWGGFRKRILSMISAMLVMGIGAALVGFSPSAGYWMGMAGVFLVGMANPFTSGSYMAIMQSRVRPELQGRVFTISEAAMLAFTPVTLLLAGPLADRFGVPLWFILFGIGTILLVTVVVTNKDVLNIEDEPHGDDAIAPQPVTVDLA